MFNLITGQYLYQCSVNNFKLSSNLIIGMIRVQFVLHVHHLPPKKTVASASVQNRCFTGRKTHKTYALCHSMDVFAIDMRKVVHNIIRKPSSFLLRG